MPIQSIHESQAPFSRTFYIREKKKESLNEKIFSIFTRAICFTVMCYLRISPHTLLIVSKWRAASFFIFPVGIACEFICSPLVSPQAQFIVTELATDKIACNSLFIARLIYSLALCSFRPALQHYLYPQEQI